MGGRVKPCRVTWVILPKLFPIGGTCTCPRCKKPLTVTGRPDINSGRFYVEHTPE